MVPSAHWTDTQMESAVLAPGGPRSRLCLEPAVCGEPVAGLQGASWALSGFPTPAALSLPGNLPPTLPGAWGVCGAQTWGREAAGGPGLFPLSYLRVLWINTIDESM